MQKNEAVVILGASNKTDRYAYMAQQGLVNRGFRVLPVHPTIKEIDGVPVFASLSDIKEPVNTITLYVPASVCEVRRAAPQFHRGPPGEDSARGEVGRDEDPARVHDELSHARTDRAVPREAPSRRLPFARPVDRPADGADGA